jgi:hypothetical protein
VEDGDGAGDSPTPDFAVRIAVVATRALAVMIELPPFDPVAVVLAALLLLELLDDELPVPLREMVIASFASPTVKSDCTVLETVPVVAVDVR